MGIVIHESNVACIRSQILTLELQLVLEPGQYSAACLNFPGEISDQICHAR